MFLRKKWCSSNFCEKEERVEKRGLVLFKDEWEPYTNLNNLDLVIWMNTKNDSIWFDNENGSVMSSKVRFILEAQFSVTSKGIIAAGKFRKRINVNVVDFRLSFDMTPTF